MITARDLMSTDPATIGTSTKVRSAVELLKTLEVRFLPIVNDEHELIGTLSDWELRGLPLPSSVAPDQAGRLRTALDASVASLMRGGILSVDEETEVAIVVDLMLEHNIGAVPVTDADGVVVGMVSYIDLLRALPFERNVAKAE
jgi:acetoin utilization protein AcuB